MNTGENTNILSAAAAGGATAVILVFILRIMAPMAAEQVTPEIVAAFGTLCTLLWGFILPPSPR